MNIHAMTPIRSVLLAAACTLLLTHNAAAQPVPGIPEPGLLLYGAVTNSNGSTPVTLGNVNWTVSGGGSSATIASLIVNVNGQYFYIARIPFETRSAGGVNFTASPNTLPLMDSAATFSRAASVLGNIATIAPPATGSFSFSKLDRGRVERVNLTASIALDPMLDSDGDGVPNWAEQIAGTNPNNALSVFKASTDIQPAPGGGLIVKWASVAGKTYSLHRSSDLGQSFAFLAGSIPAAAPQNQFTDATATGTGPYFYRIQVNP